MTEKQKKKCNKIIHAASMAAGVAGAGFAQIPGGDRILITPIQLAMAMELAKVFDINLIVFVPQEPSPFFLFIVINS